MFAYILINVLDDEQGVQRALENLAPVKEVHILFGEWDLIAKVEMDAPEALSGFVMEKIRCMEDVKVTSTLIVAK